MPMPTVSSTAWQRQLHHWDKIKEKYGLHDDRYDDFRYLTFLDIDDFYINDYFEFHAFDRAPVFKHRLRHHIAFWRTLPTPAWILDFIESGVKISFETIPPRIMLPNSSSTMTNSNMAWIRATLLEFESFGFIEKVDWSPHCVLPLQIAEGSDKKSLIYDMSILNDYVLKSKFKLESWEEMFNYSILATHGIKFDLKKFYHQIDIFDEESTYYGFMYVMSDGADPTCFVWKTLPYGYTRAPFIARALMKPLIAKWRLLGIKTVVFYDDGMAVDNDPVLLRRSSLQMQCDLIRAGLIPGVTKCCWSPQSVIQWNGLVFDFIEKGISIIPRRIDDTICGLSIICTMWPKVTFRELAQIVGKIVSWKPVFGGLVMLRTKSVQTFVNIRNNDNLSWDSMICANYRPLYGFALSELHFWLNKCKDLNFRSFELPKVDWLAWSDASDVSVATFAVQLRHMDPPYALTVDNFLLDDSNMMPIVAHRAKLQVDTLPWLYRENSSIRDAFDLDPRCVKWHAIAHRNLRGWERTLSSTERELLAILHFLTSLRDKLVDQVVTLHTDSQNAATILESGSNKPRLNMYATTISNMLLDNNIKLNCVWIPRSLNNVADLLSKQYDFDDFSVTTEFFNNVCEDFLVRPTFDRFANTENTLTPLFNSLTYCANTAGVDAFNYDWSLTHLNWIFCPVKLILRSLNYLRLCKASALFLVPQWKFSFFYSVFENLEACHVINRRTYNARGCIRSGSDATSFFGPDFDGNVTIWHLRF